MTIANSLFALGHAHLQLDFHLYHKTIMHVSSDIMSVSPKRLKYAIQFYSMVRTGSAFNQVRVICMCNVDLRSDIFQHVFIYIGPTTKDVGALNSYICSLLVSVKEALNSVIYIHKSIVAYNRKVMSCYSKIVPAHMMPILFNMSCLIIALAGMIIKSVPP